MMWALKAKAEAKKKIDALAGELAAVEGQVHSFHMPTELGLSESSFVPVDDGWKVGEIKQISVFEQHEFVSLSNKVDKLWAKVQPEDYGLAYVTLPGMNHSLSDMLAKFPMLETAPALLKQEMLGLLNEHQKGVVLKIEELEQKISTPAPNKQKLSMLEIISALKDHNVFVSSINLNQSGVEHLINIDMTLQILGDMKESAQTAHALHNAVLKSN